MAHHLPQRRPGQELEADEGRDRIAGQAEHRDHPLGPFEEPEGEADLLEELYAEAVGLGLDCALIVGWRQESHDLRLSLNDVLREYEIAV